MNHRAITAGFGLLIILLIGGFVFFSGMMSNDGDVLDDSGNPVADGAGGPPENNSARRERGDDLASGSDSGEPGQDPSTLNEEKTGSSLGALYGQAVDEKTRTPIDGLTATLTHIKDGPDAIVKTAEGGGFRFGDLEDFNHGSLVLHGSGMISLPIRNLRVQDGSETNLGEISVGPITSLRGNVVSADGKPISGARILLLENQAVRTMDGFDIFKIIRQIFHEDESLDETTTGSAGDFEFTRIPAGEYAILASADGYQSKHSRSLITRKSEAPPRARLTLTTGRPLSGLVVDQDGSAIAGAVIALLPNASGIPEVLKTVKAVSGRDGRFAFSSLGDAQYSLMVRADGYCMSLGREIRPGEKETRIVLQQGTSVSGRVFEKATGNGLAGVRIAVIQPGAAGSFSETESGEDGTYTVDGVSTSEELQIVARLTGFTMDGVDDSSVRFMGGISLKREGSGPITHNIAMVGGGTVEGRVYDPSTGAGIAGARVRIVALSTLMGGLGDKKASTTTTDDEGNYRLTDASPGPFFMVASKAGYVPDESGNGKEGLPEHMERFFRDPANYAGPRMHAGGTVTGQDVPMIRGATVKGIVQNKEGKPIQGARIEWKRRAVTPLLMLARAGDDSSTAATSDEKGVFELQGVSRADAVTIVGSHPDYAAGGERTTDTLSGELTEFRLVLEPGATLRIRFLLPDDIPAAGIPVSLRPEQSGGIQIDMMGRNEESRAVTDAEGRILVANMKAGKFRLRIRNRAELELPKEFRTIELEAGRTKEVEIRLRSVAFIKGRVVDAKGIPLFGANLRAVVISEKKVNETRGWGFSDQNGEFTITGVVEGESYDISVSKQDVTMVEGERKVTDAYESTVVEDVAAGSTDVEIVLEKK